MLALGYAVCPQCNSTLVTTIRNPVAKILLTLLIMLTSFIGLAISVVAASISYPYLTKWLCAGSLLIAEVCLFVAIINLVIRKWVAYRVK